MKALRHRLAELDSGVRNAWLLIAILVVALICTMETMAGLAADSVSAVDCLAEFIFVAIVGRMAFRPVTGCVAVAVAWIVLCMSPIWMPSGAMLAVLLAVGIAGYADKRLALAVAGIAVVVWMLSRGGVAIPWLDGGSDTMSGSADGAASSSALDGSVADGGAADGGSSSSGSDSAGQSGSDFTGSAYESSGSSAEHRTGQVILGAIALYGVMPVAVLFIGFMLGGMAARWNHERSLARAELAHRRQQERTAQDIHDYVSNDLAYLILRFDKDIADGKTPSEEELRELRSVAMGALDRTHQVIDVIEGRGEAAHSAVTPHDSTVDAVSGIACGITDADCPLAEQIRDVASNGDRRLSELGFEGQTIISGAHGAAGRSGLIAGLLEELYGNIAKHADPEAGYVMTIGIGLDTVRIACIDTARTSSDSDADGSVDLSTGTGLNRYRQLLEQQNGALHITTQDAEWTLSAVIPL